MSTQSSSKQTINQQENDQVIEQLKCGQVTDFTAGILAQHFDHWTALTSDSWVLQVIKGYRIDFV